MKAHDLLIDADAFRAAYPHWPSVEPAPPAPLAAALPWCQSCGTHHISLTVPCPPAEPCADCGAKPGESCGERNCPRLVETVYSEEEQNR